MLLCRLNSEDLQKRKNVPFCIWKLYGTIMWWLVKAVSLEYFRKMAPAYDGDELIW